MHRPRGVAWGGLPHVRTARVTVQHAQHAHYTVVSSLLFFAIMSSIFFTYESVSFCRPARQRQERHGRPCMHVKRASWRQLVRGSRVCGRCDCVESDTQHAARTWTLSCRPLSSSSGRSSLSAFLSTSRRTLRTATFDDSPSDATTCSLTANRGSARRELLTAGSIPRHQHAYPIRCALTAHSQRCSLSRNRAFRTIP